VIGPLQHVAVSARDLAASVEFYTAVMGLSVIHRAHHEGEAPERISGVPGARIEVCVVGAGGLRIELLQYAERRDPGPRHPEQNRVGLSHICFQVSDIQGEYERIRGLGYRFYSPPLFGRDDGPKVCYFEGPDNVVIELYEPRPAAG
jgi:catechol 2,3-dioxygenase-like lactoylglutathione lyase family enzyme